MVDLGGCCQCQVSLYPIRFEELIELPTSLVTELRKYSWFLVNSLYTAQFYD